MAAPPPHDELQTVLNSMCPELQDGTYAFVSLDSSLASSAPIPWPEVVASIREREGLSLIVPLAVARREHWPVLFEAKWITLTLHTDLALCGLTAAFARALAERRIACNVVAGALRDHIFVPAAQAGEAMDALRAMKR